MIAPATGHIFLPAELMFQAQRLKVIVISPDF
jgi:hypothetical protein